MIKIYFLLLFCALATGCSGNSDSIHIPESSIEPRFELTKCSSSEDSVSLFLDFKKLNSDLPNTLTLNYKENIVERELPNYEQGLWVELSKNALESLNSIVIHSLDSTYTLNAENITESCNYATFEQDSLTPTEIIKVTKTSDLLLSSNGSDRATAYQSATKLIDTEDFLYITYLEFLSEEHVAVLAVLDKNTNQINQVQLGSVRDNHGGGALLLHNGKVYVFYDGHGVAIKYKIFEQGLSLLSLSEEFSIDGSYTYPTVASVGDSILLLARKGGNVRSTEPWSLESFLIREDNSFSSQTIYKSNQLNVNYVNRYTHFQQKIIVDDSGLIHLTFILNERPEHNWSQLSANLNYGLVYLQSTDGVNWKDASLQQLALPITIGEELLIAGTTSLASVTNFIQSATMTYSPSDKAVIVSYSQYNLINDNWSIKNILLKNGEEFETTSDQSFYQIKSIKKSVNEKTYIFGEKITKGLTPVTAWKDSNNKIAILEVSNNGHHFSLIDNLLSNELSWFPNVELGLNEERVYYLYMVGSEVGSKVYLGWFNL